MISVQSNSSMSASVIHSVPPLQEGPPLNRRQTIHMGTQHTSLVRIISQTTLLHTEIILHQRTTTLHPSCSVDLHSLPLGGCRKAPRILTLRQPHIYSIAD